MIWLISPSSYLVYKAECLTLVNIIVIYWLPRNYGYVNKPFLRAAPSGSVRLLP